MKKYRVLATALIAAFAVQTTVMAATVALQSDNASVSYTYSIEEEAVLDADKLFVKPDGFPDGESITDTLVITNKTQDEGVIEISLRLSANPVSDTWLYSPLDYYSFVISDESGNVLYDSADAELSDVSDESKDIILGTFNDKSDSDTKTYKIEYMVSEKGAANLSKEDVADLTFSLVANEIAEKQVQELPTAKPKFEITTPVESEKVILTEKSDSTEQPEVTEAPAATEAPVKEKKLVCGTDIDAGRYVVTGNGIVKVESKTGTLESEAMLNDGTVEGIDGEESTIITVSDGDVVTLLPLEGQEKASVALEKTNSGSSAANTTRTSDGKTTSDKTNPKTGDTSTVAVCVVMVLAVAGISVLELLKRKRVK